MDGGLPDPICGGSSYEHDLSVSGANDPGERFGQHLISIVPVIRFLGITDRVTIKFYKGLYSCPAFHLCGDDC